MLEQLWKKVVAVLKIRWQFLARGTHSHGVTRNDLPPLGAGGGGG